MIMKLKYHLEMKQKRKNLLIMGLLVIIIPFIFNKIKPKDLILTTKLLKVEFGNKVSTSVGSYLDYRKLSKKSIKDIIENTIEEDNLKYVKVIHKDENGRIISREEKDYPQVGNYEISFNYRQEKVIVKVIVRDTIKPEIKAPNSIDIAQYTDLSSFDFSELLEAIDYSNLEKWKIDISKVDTHKFGTYTIKVSIQDKYKNKASKILKVNVVDISKIDGKEVVADKRINKKNEINKKSNTDILDDTAKKKVPISNKKIENSSSKSIIQEHEHNYSIPVTKIIHHDTQTKIVHHEAIIENQPIYETHYICKVCNKDFGKDDNSVDEAIMHNGDTGHSYHSASVQIGMKEVVVKQANDEVVIIKQAYDESVVSYKCSCGAIK